MDNLKQILKNIKPGDHFELKGIEWVCLDPNYNEDGKEGIFAIAAKLEPEIVFAVENSEHDWSDYTYSEVRKYLKNKYEKLLKDITLVHKCDLRTDNGDEQYPAVYDNVFVLSFFEYFRYIDYVPRYDNWHWLRSASRGYSGHTWIVSASGYVGGSLAVYALGCAPACVIYKSSVIRGRSLGRERVTNYEVFESKTVKGRIKKYVVADADADRDGVIRYTKKLFKCTADHVMVVPGYLYKDLLYLEDPGKRGTKKVTVAYWA